LESFVGRQQIQQILGKRHDATTNPSEIQHLLVFCLPSCWEIEPSLVTEIPRYRLHCATELCIASMEAKHMQGVPATKQLRK